MDGATLQSRIYSGYAKAASRVGYSNLHYRPSSALNPIAVGNKLANIYASFNAQDMKYGKPNKYGNPLWYGLFDGSQTRVGDYLIDPVVGDFFIAAQQQALPILCVSCNTIVNITRPAQQAAVGALPYGGTTPPTETMLMQQWPCSLIMFGGGKKDDAILPGDTVSMNVQVLLPYFSGVTLAMADVITDQLGRRFTIANTELTDLGWRLTAKMAIVQI